MDKEKFVKSANEIIMMKDMYENGWDPPDWISIQEIEKLEDVLSPILMRMKPRR